MKVILFCQNTYSFGILDPIKEVLIAEKHSFIWYVAEKILTDFPFKKDNHTTKISDLLEFQSDVIFVPGNAGTLRGSGCSSRRGGTRCRVASR